MKRFFLPWLVWFSLAAQETVDLTSRAETYFQNEEYAKAFPLYLEAAAKYKKPEIAYKLGWMYEQGKGIGPDPIEALHWYKLAADWQLNKTNKKEVYETIYRNVNPLHDDASTNTLVQLVDGKFGLRAYEPNYLVVLNTDTVPNGEPILMDQSQDTHYIHTEIKYQISLRADYITHWFGFTQMWSGAYTQVSWWQVFIQSAPFRETNYKPEVFVSIPFFHRFDTVGFKAFSIGYKHSSNGQPMNHDENATHVRPGGPLENSPSRSWNRIYARGYFQWSNVYAELTAWFRIDYASPPDDNPDIMEYLGEGSLEVGYVHGKLLSRLTLYPSFSGKRLGGQLDFSYPVPLSDNVFFYLQAFSGYGRSLIDYDKHSNQVGFGLSISR